MEAKQSAGEEPQQPSQPQPNTPILSTGAIVGLIVGGVVFLLLAALIVKINKTKRQNTVDLKKKNKNNKNRTPGGGPDTSGTGLSPEQKPQTKQTAQTPLPRRRIRTTQDYADIDEKLQSLTDVVSAVTGTHNEQGYRNARTGRTGRN